MRRRARQLVAPALLALGSVTSVLLAAELLLRLSGFAPAPHEPPLRLINTGRQIVLDCYPSDPRSYFDVDLRDERTYAHYRRLGVRRLRRAAGRAPHCVEVRYNSDRHRGDEVAPRRPGVRRVAVLGDSFTEGQGVKEADAYPLVLQELLNRGEPERWEVLNCGHRAADFPELHEMFYRVLRYDPDVVVYGMVPNDVEQTAALRARDEEVRDWITIRGRRLRGRYDRLGLFESRLVFLLRERIETYRITRATIDWYRGLYSEANAAGWGRTRQRLREMDGRMRQRGGRLLVASWPLLARFPDRYPLEDVHATIGRFCREAGIAVHDLLPALRAAAGRSLVVHDADAHPNERAHALAARSLLPAVRELAAALPPRREP